MSSDEAQRLLSEVLADFQRRETDSEDVADVWHALIVLLQGRALVPEEIEDERSAIDRLRVEAELPANTREAFDVLVSETRTRFQRERTRLRREIKREGVEEVHERLRELGPDRATWDALIAATTRTGRTSAPRARESRSRSRVARASASSGSDDDPHEPDAGLGPAPATPPPCPRCGTARYVRRNVPGLQPGSWSCRCCRLKIEHLSRAVVLWRLTEDGSEWPIRVRRGP
jgi:hypothetical protein